LAQYIQQSKAASAFMTKGNYVKVVWKGNEGMTLGFFKIALAMAMRCF